MKTTLSLGAMVSLALMAGASSLASAEAAAQGVDVAVASSDGIRSFNAEDVPTFDIAEDGTVDWPTFSGYRRYQSECHVCHGPDGMGSSYAPALKDSVMRIDYYTFLETIANGKQGGRSRQDAGDARLRHQCERHVLRRRHLDLSARAAPGRSTAAGRRSGPTRAPNMPRWKRRAWSDPRSPAVGHGPRGRARSGPGGGPRLERGPARLCRSGEFAPVEPRRQRLREPHRRTSGAGDGQARRIYLVSDGDGLCAQHALRRQV